MRVNMHAVCRRSKAEEVVLDPGLKARRAGGKPQRGSPTWRGCCHGEKAPGKESSLFRRSSNPNIERCCEQGGLPATPPPPPLAVDPVPADGDPFGTARGVGIERCGDASSDSLNVGDAGLRGAGVANVPFASVWTPPSVTRPAAMTAEIQALSDGREMGAAAGSLLSNGGDGAFRFSVWTLMAACDMKAPGCEPHGPAMAPAARALTCRTATMRGVRSAGQHKRLGSGSDDAKCSAAAGGETSDTSNARIRAKWRA